MPIEMAYFPFGRYANHDAKPTLQQRRIAHRAVFIAGVLQSLVAKLTVRQQMVMLETIRGWGVVVDARPASEPRLAQTGTQNGAHPRHEMARAPGDF